MVCLNIAHGKYFMPFSSKPHNPIPIIIQSESNKLNVQNLINVNEELKISIRSSLKKCCCLRFDDLIFGRLDQAKYILMETFDGKPILLDGPDGNKIDCMFFPCSYLIYFSE